MGASVCVHPQSSDVQSEPSIDDGVTARINVFAGVDTAVGNEMMRRVSKPSGFEERVDDSMFAFVGSKVFEQCIAGIVMANSLLLGAHAQYFARWGHKSE